MFDALEGELAKVIAKLDPAISKAGFPREKFDGEISGVIKNGFRMM